MKEVGAFGPLGLQSLLEIFARLASGIDEHTGGPARHDLSPASARHEWARHDWARRAIVPGLNRLRAQGSAQGTSRGPIFVPGWPVKHGTRRRAGRPKSPSPKNISTDFKKIPDLKSRHELFTFHMYSKHKGKHPQIQKAKTPKTTKTNRDKFKLLGRAVCAMLPH